MLAGFSTLVQRRGWVRPKWVVWLALPLYLAAGAWAGSKLGLHALRGAYFAGAILAPAWSRQIPVEGIGKLALLGLASLFFGHSGIKIDGDALGWASLQVAVALLVVPVLTKLAAVLICPPVSTLSRRETLAISALLQCKGLMEIVAAKVLRDKGLLSEHAFAALVTLAVLSTLLTGPFSASCSGRARNRLVRRNRRRSGLDSNRRDTRQGDTTAFYFGTRPGTGPGLRMEAPRLMIKRPSNVQSDRELNVTEDTFKFHARNIFGNLGASSRSKAVALSLKSGLMPSGDL